MNKKHFVALTVIIALILIATTITITLAQKDEAHESFKNYFKDKLTQMSRSKQIKFEEFQQLNPASKFIQAGKLQQNKPQNEEVVEVNNE